ncbi:glycoside hydrolase family 65 protein [Enterococcus timonensis]|uniref:glycoside hydrolase family 65 protein n=1 Tax=Enterococcus timonensis TaxID=1852364 RepID=UPI0008DA217B|nr:glycosyl hydrolase family 65 protein [Enterococcus timonensis]
MDYVLVKETAEAFIVGTMNKSVGKFEKIWSPETFEKIGQAIKNSETPLAGGILVGFSKLYFDQEAVTYSVQQLIEESTNLPFVSGEVENVARALAKRQEEFVWSLDYFGFVPGKSEYATESLLTVGNGLFGLRGVTPEMEISEATYPATYLAGLYDAKESKVAGEKVTNEDFVNAPNAQVLYFEVAGKKVGFSKETVSHFSRHLNLKTGLFSSSVILTADGGEQFKVEVEKFAGLENFHTYGLRYKITALNFNGEVTLVSAIDGGVYNFNVERYRSLEQKHLAVVTQKALDGNIFQWAKTTASDFQILQGANLTGNFKRDLVAGQDENKIWQKGQLELQENETVVVEKMVNVYHFAAEKKSAAAKKWETSWSFGDFSSEYVASKKQWENLWSEMKIVVDGDMWSQKLLNLHTYHSIVSAAPFANLELDASITARGLHGEAYRGHIFWDELFILPFYVLHFPKAARQILMYRYSRLEMAKKEAAQEGFSGAMFPWQSGLDGSEQSQRLHLNPLDGSWGEDHSRLQRHVSLAIAYNLWFYVHVTGDTEFLNDYAAEMYLEIAKFWLSKAELLNNNRYSIAGVMGPDEFHEAYPDSEEGGLKDNAYTNMMVVWLMEVIATLPEKMSEKNYQAALEKVGFSETELKKAEVLKHQLHLEINDEGIIAQYAGYFDLEELDFAAYKEKYGNIYRMDRILSAEGKSADNYQVAKQADSLMIFYNLAKKNVDEILNDLAYDLPEDYVKKNLDYYLARTSHGSTLSRVVHAQLAQIAGDETLAYTLYQEALSSDYHDIQGGTTAEGIHAGVMAATLWITLSAFAGLDVSGEMPTLAPKLPVHWQKLSFQFEFLQQKFYVTVDHESATIFTPVAGKILVNGQVVNLPAGEKVTVAL